MKFPFDINIEAKNQDEANNLMQAMVDLKTAALKKMTTNDFIEFAEKVKLKPTLIVAAKFVVLKR